MYGRYGVDLLSLVILIIGLIVSSLGQLFRFWPLLVLSYLLYIYALYRVFSKKIPARQRELAAVMGLKSRLVNWFSFKKKQFSERKLYKYFSCPSCRQKLRAPRGRGKIQVTCQKCKKSFVTKT